LFVTEKSPQCVVKFVGTFNVRHVPAVVDYLQSRTRYLFVKSLGEIQWDEFIFAAPHNERRFMDRAKAAVQDIFAADQC
jgi:hypothetical protein